MSIDRQWDPREWQGEHDGEPSEVDIYADRYQRLIAGDDTDMHAQKFQIIKRTRKAHDCAGYGRHVIPVGSRAFLETGVADGEWSATYVCIPCLDAVNNGGDPNNTDLPGVNP